MMKGRAWFGLVPALFVAACSTGTTLRSDPGGAAVYVDGERIGTSPLTHNFSIMQWNQSYEVRFVLEGYEDEIYQVRRIQKGLMGRGGSDWPESVFVRLKKKEPSEP